MNLFLFGAAGIPAPIDFPFDGAAVAAACIAAFFPVFLALRRPPPATRPAAVAAAPVAAGPGPRDAPLPRAA